MMNEPLTHLATPISELSSPCQRKTSHSSTDKRQSTSNRVQELASLMNTEVQIDFTDHNEENTVKHTDVDRLRPRGLTAGF